jgi:hypothetical protein
MLTRIDWGKFFCLFFIRFFHSIFIWLKIKLYFFLYGKRFFSQIILIALLKILIHLLSLPNVFHVIKKNQLIWLGQVYNLNRIFFLRVDFFYFFIYFSFYFEIEFNRKEIKINDFRIETIHFFLYVKIKINEKISWFWNWMKWQI